VQRTFEFLIHNHISPIGGDFFSLSASHLKIKIVRVRCT